MRIRINQDQFSRLIRSVLVHGPKLIMGQLSFGFRLQDVDDETANLTASLDVGIRLEREDVETLFNDARSDTLNKTLNDIRSMAAEAVLCALLRELGEDEFNRLAGRLMATEIVIQRTIKGDKGVSGENNKT